MSSVLAAAVSMPFNQLFNFLSTQPAGAEARGGLLRACARFLVDQYVKPGTRCTPSATILRDIGMRCAYVAPQLSTYSAIERAVVSLARPSRPSN